MSMLFLYITNDPAVAQIAQRHGVDRVWIDLETIGKEERQRHISSNKNSHHSLADIRRMRPFLTASELLVRINPIHEGSAEEIDTAIAYGADRLMLPMWHTAEEVATFLSLVAGRVKTTLLLETKGAVGCLDAVIAQGGFDDLHIGLNDLYLSYGMDFLFEPLACGIVDTVCEKCRAAGIPFGFGGVARIGEGQIPAERVLSEHRRLGSGAVILSRSFCSPAAPLSEIEATFARELPRLRETIASLQDADSASLAQNRTETAALIEAVCRENKANRK